MKEMHLLLLTLIDASRRSRVDPVSISEIRADGSLLFPSFEGITAFPVVETHRGTLLDLSVGKEVSLPKLDCRITRHPSSVILGSGSTLELSVGYESSMPVKIQWEKNGIVLLDETSDTLTIPAVQTDDAGSYRVVLTVGREVHKSFNSFIRVINAPEILEEPSSVLVKSGETTASLSIIAAGEEPLTYQWIKDGEFIAQATTNTLDLTAVSSEDVGLYSVRISNSHGNVESIAVSLSRENLSNSQISVIRSTPRTDYTHLEKTSLAAAFDGLADVQLITWEKDGEIIDAEFDEEGHLVSSKHGLTYDVGPMNTYDQGAYRLLVETTSGTEIVEWEISLSPLEDFRTSLVLVDRDGAKDTDGDGIPNAFEYIYQSDPNVKDPKKPEIFSPARAMTGTEAMNIEPTLSLDEGESYTVITTRHPAEIAPAVIDVQASSRLDNFNNSEFIATPLGEARAEGDLLHQDYIVTPGVDAAKTLFWRMLVELPLD